MDSDPEDAITTEEMTGTAPAPGTSSAGRSSGVKRNAFDMLMGATPDKPIKTVSKGGARGAFLWKDGLGAYTSHQDPASFWPDVVLYANQDFVAIHDKYPKSTVHTLLLPRSPLSRKHPFDAFEDADFLAAVKTATAELKRRVAAELRRLYGSNSAQEKLRESVLNGEVDWDPDKPLPEGRDWEKEVLVGVHAKPSMNDLHVHVLSRDMVGKRMLKNKHYLSFNTPFLVDIADFPLAKDDPRRDSAHRRAWLHGDLRCWRCGKNFANKLSALKAHLEVEFEEWKKE
ncbi:HIT domain-containing protein [Poronia punctata]|nr:HIT domain-containing protein [Poronia punctata]